MMLQLIIIFLDMIVPVAMMVLILCGFVFGGMFLWQALWKER